MPIANGHIQKILCPSWVILYLGDSQRFPFPVSPSEAVDVRSAEAGKAPLERGHPRFELATTLLAPAG